MSTDSARIGDGVVVAFGGRTPVTDFGPFYQLPGFKCLDPGGAFYVDGGFEAVGVGLPTLRKLELRARGQTSAGRTGIG